MVRRIRKKQYKRHKKWQRGGFLNRHDFAYAGRDMLNQAMDGLAALAPKVIKQATGQADQTAQRRIQQIVNQEGQKVETIVPKIIKGATEEVFKTPFRLLGRFGKNSCIVLVEKLKRVLENTAWKDKKKCLKHNFISTFTFSFTTAIIIFQTFNNSNILTNGRHERDYIRRE